MYSSRTRVSFSPSSSAFGNRVKLCRGASTASMKARTLSRAVYVEGTITSISRYAAWIITAPSAISRLDLVALSEPAAPTAPRARASAAAPASVERADEALLYARLGLAVVVGDIEPGNILIRRPHHLELDTVTHVPSARTREILPL